MTRPMIGIPDPHGENIAAALDEVALGVSTEETPASFRALVVSGLPEVQDLLSDLTSHADGAGARPLFGAVLFDLIAGPVEESQAAPSP